MSRSHLLLVILLVAFGSVRGQWSGAATASFGWNSNPLYNYEMVGDYLTQGYVDLRYGSRGPSTNFAAAYTGGLMLFHDLSDRTYYEHRLSAQWDRSYGRPLAKPQPTQSGDEGEGEETDVSDGSFPDSSFSSLSVALTAASRHDHEAYDVYDNVGAEVFGAYKFPLGNHVFSRIATQGGYRSYTNLTAESNIYDVTWVEFGLPLDHATVGGISVSFGVKHFTQSLYDTSTVDTQVPISQSKGGNGGNRGKGKGSGSGGNSGKGHQKALLINPTSLTTWHAGFDIFFRHLFSGGSVDVRARYDIAPSSKGRYVGQYSSSTVLYEDIYNDFFTYGGLSGAVKVRRSLPFRLQGTLTGAFAQKNFVGPALDLTGASLGDKRIDLRGQLEVGISRYVELSEAVGLDISLTGELLRNQSNDAYNDYSLQSIILGVGVGF